MANAIQYQLEVQWPGMNQIATFGPFIKLEDATKGLLATITVGAN